MILADGLEKVPEKKQRGYWKVQVRYDSGFGQVSGRKEGEEKEGQAES